MVKGVNFVELRDAGDPVEIAARYNEQGADELTFLDITATSDERDLILPIIEAVACQVFIPLTVGGGVRTVDDVRRLLNAGADKTSFNSAAHRQPRRDRGGLGQVRRAVHRGGDRRQAAQPRKTQRRAARAGTSTATAGARTPVWTRWHGPTKWRGAAPARSCSPAWTATAPSRGFDLALTRAVSDAVSVPVIASGGVGNLDHLADGIQQGGADAVLAASIFHYGEYTVGQAKASWPRAASRCVSEALAAAGPRRSGFLRATALHGIAGNRRQSRHELARRSQMGRAGAGPGDRAGSGQRRRADVRLDEPRGACKKPPNWAARCISAARAASCGSRARSPATCRRCMRSAWTATTT